MNQDIVIEAKDVSKAFPGVRALDGIKLQIRRGEIHSIIGENGAGKSTLMKIFSGVFPPDAGSIVLNGEPVVFKSVFGAFKSGISIIFQEFNLMPELSVAENISISDIPNKGVVVDKKAMEKKARELIQNIGIKLNPRSFIKDLSVSQCQLVEILRAISNDSQIIIMDEPTGALNNEESEILFDIIRKLNKQGTTIIYISHKMKEVFQISDRITVLRDGKLITTVDAKDTDQETMVKMMVGRDIDFSNKYGGQSIGDVIYSVRNACVPGLFEDISFDVKRGEILGITGLMGCGSIELAKKLYGLIPEGKCTQSLRGEELAIDSPSDAMDKGIALVTDDRKNSGNFAKMTAMENASISILHKIRRRSHLIDLRMEHKYFADYVNQFNIKCTANQQMSNLSGGNQQKILVSRALMTSCKVLILLEPTRGVDVGAKSQMHQIIHGFAEKGIAVIIVSSDLPEVIQLADRVMVMYNGRSQGFLEGHEINEDYIMLKAAGLKEKNR
jgi:ABC-type sugar transport system ATPase subunit